MGSLYVYIYKLTHTHIYMWSGQFSRSVVSDSRRPHGLKHTRLPCPSLTPEAWSKPLSIESVMPSNHILCVPLFLLPSVLPSSRVFSNESILLIKWPKYWSLSFNLIKYIYMCKQIYLFIECVREATLKRASKWLLTRTGNQSQ